MKEFIEKLVGRLEEEAFKIQLNQGIKNPSTHDMFLETFTVRQIEEIVNEFAEEYNNGWIPCSERLPECENKYGWVSCIVSVIRSHYPTSTYDICDAPYDENIVMCANYNVSQKIWHLDCDEQLNALIDIEDAPLNCDYVIAWQPLPQPYKEEGV